MLPTEIQLTLRIPKANPLYAQEMDDNLVALRSAILGIASALRASRVVVGVEPAPGEREGVLWIPITGTRKGMFRWDTGTSTWIRVINPPLFSYSGGTATDFTLALQWGFANYTEVNGHTIFFRAHTAITGATTLNVNALGPMPIKRVVSGSLGDVGSGDIVNGGVYAVILDEGQFILLNPSERTAAQTGPVFITPVTVYSGGAKAWTTYNASAVVPSNARAVKFEITGTGGIFPGTQGSVVASYRGNGSSPTYKLIDVQSAAGDAIKAFAQVELPITVPQQFDYKVEVTTAGTADIRLVGYVL